MSEVTGKCATEAVEDPRHELTCDQEAWILDALETLCGMAYLIKSQRVVSAHRGMMDAAINGAIHGMAEEIAHLCGAVPCYVNFKHRRYPAPIANPLAGSAIWNQAKQSTEPRE